MALTKSQLKQFKEWMEDGNVSKNNDGTYSTQDAQYRNKLKDLNELKKYFKKEFIADEYEHGGSMGSNNKNGKYLDSISSDKKSKILKNIASHYGFSVGDAEEEVRDADAEMLYEYIANDQSLRMDVYNDMERGMMEKGGDIMGVDSNGLVEKAKNKVGKWIFSVTYADMIDGRKVFRNYPNYVSEYFNSKTEAEKALQEKLSKTNKMAKGGGVGKNKYGHEFSVKRGDLVWLADEGNNGLMALVISEPNNKNEIEVYIRGYGGEKRLVEFSEIQYVGAELLEYAQDTGDLIHYPTIAKRMGVKFNPKYEQMLEDDKYANGGGVHTMPNGEVMLDSEHYANGGNVVSIAKKVAEVNALIERANELGLKIVNENITWQSPMKYKPFKYSNGVLYEEYEELDLYKANRGKGVVWKTFKNKTLKANMQYDNPLNEVAKMYRKALKHYDTYGYANGGKMAKGGGVGNKSTKNTNIKKRPKNSQPKMVRQYFEDSPYSYAHGGSMDSQQGIDLFEDYENIPANVQSVLDNHEDAFMDGDYKELQKALTKLKKIGYTFEFDLDGQAYDLRPIGTKGKSEMNIYANGGGMEGKKSVKSYFESINLDKLPAQAKDYINTQILNDSDIDLIDLSDEDFTSIQQVIAESYPQAIDGDMSDNTTTSGDNEDSLEDAIESLQTLLEFADEKERKSIEEAIEALELLV